MIKTLTLSEKATGLGALLSLLLSLLSINLSAHTYASLSPANKTMKNILFTTSGDLDIKPSETSSKSDFDFLMGPHKVHHKKLKTRLNNSNEWAEFDGTHDMHGLLNGIGNLEQHWMPGANGKPIEGMALRLFNPATKLWSIYWSDSERGVLDIPVTGSFENGIGYFFAKDTFNGKPILLQFKWDASNPDKPVWSQAFSPDNGKTWEWNWYMYFTKENTKPDKQDLNVNQNINVIELRNYLIKPGQRDRFIDYFEDHLVQPQNELKGYILGQYRVKGAEDNFFWIRGFKDMQVRNKFLNDFYHGPVWKQHKNIPNSMLLNNDNVHLLRPLSIDHTEKSTLGFNSNWFGKEKGITVVDFYTSNQKLPKLIDFFKTRYLSILKNAEIEDVSLWVSENTPNEFTQLPVFQDKNLLVSITFYKDELEYQAKLRKAELQINDSLRSEMMDLITIRNTLILYPTERSFLIERN